MEKGKKKKTGTELDESFGDNQAANEKQRESGS
jgi:hypothetical protein